MKSCLTEALKGNGCPTPNKADLKTFQINGFLFKEVGLLEDIQKLYNYLSLDNDTTDTNKSGECNSIQTYKFDKLQNVCAVTHSNLNNGRELKKRNSSRWEKVDKKEEKLVNLKRNIAKKGDDKSKANEDYVSDEDLLLNESKDTNINKFSSKTQVHEAIVDLGTNASINLQDIGDSDFPVKTSNEREGDMIEEKTINNLKRMRRHSQHGGKAYSNCSKISDKIETNPETKLDFHSQTNTRSKTNSRSTIDTKSSEKESKTTPRSKCTRSKRKSAQKLKPEGKLKSLSERRLTLKCNVCGKVCASEKFLDRHMRIKHSDDTDESFKDKPMKQKKMEAESMNVCSVCQKQFSDKYSLQTHMRHIHSANPTSYQCDLCGAILKFKGSLVQHMKSVHTDKRPHTCTICNKHFKVLHQLKNHQRRHDPDLIDTCTICGKTVKKGHLSGHIKRHSDDRKHSCNTCGKKFFEKQDLIRHLRIHSGEKPFKCSFCPYTCAIKGNLTKHIIHKHREGPYNVECFSATKPYIARKISQPSSHKPSEEETTRVYVLASNEVETVPDMINKSVVDGIRYSDHTEASIHSSSTSISMSQSQTESRHYSSETTTNIVRNTFTAPNSLAQVYDERNGLRPAVTCNNERNDLTPLYTEHNGLTPVYNEDTEPNVYYSMRPVVRLGQSDDQIVSSSSVTQVVATPVTHWETYS